MSISPVAKLCVVAVIKVPFAFEKDCTALAHVLSPLKKTVELGIPVALKS